METQGIIDPPRDRGGAFRVALVCLPFAASDRPSIQVGLMTAIARRAGYQADSFHLNVELAARLTPQVYEPLCNHRGHMTGEWLFSVAAFGEEACGPDEDYFRAFPAEVEWVRRGGRDATFLSRLRHEILPAFVDDCLHAVDWSGYKVIGFSSTFQQNVACLALARRIKRAHPHAVTVFGGANMEDEMGPEYLRAFPFIDYVVIGEGDVLFPTLLGQIERGEAPEALPGLAHRDGLNVRARGQAPPVRDLDNLPTPDYDEYYARMRQHGLLQDPKYEWMVPFEGSRGCWWGQKHHCTFCGLNGLGMAFRAKTPDRIMDELTELSRRYRVNNFEATDNILDHRLIHPLFDRFSESKVDYQFFFEVKANLTREQIRALYRGGVRSIQPGIESLSTHVLRLMRKGCTMLQNVRLLKWCRYYKIRVRWNLIWGFPGETEEDYRGALAVARLLTHLEPPSGMGRIWLERFSPYFTERTSFPIREIRPEASYRHVYPVGIDVEKIAYFFDYAMSDTTGPELHSETRDWIERWKATWYSEEPDTLSYRRTLDSLLIDDNRRAMPRGSHAFHGPMALIYEFCGETMRTVGQVADHLATTGHPYPCDEVGAALDRFCQLGLMIAEDGQYLSLALPSNPNW